MMRTMQELWTFLDSLDWSTPDDSIICDCDVCQEERRRFRVDNDDN